MKHCYADLCAYRISKRSRMGCNRLRIQAALTVFMILYKTKNYQINISLAYSRTFFLEHISEPPSPKNTTYHQVFKGKFDEET